MKNAYLRFEAPECRNLESALHREWLETNGLGGFAAGTIAGIHTRRYHGLLTAATRPPGGRVLLLSKLEETLARDGLRLELSSNRYPGVIHPDGYKHIVQFRMDPLPVFVYAPDGCVVEKRICMVHGENTTVVQYTLADGPHAAETDWLLELRPLIAFRDYHGTTHENPVLDRSFQQSDGLCRIRPYDGLPALYLAHNASEAFATGHWYHNFEYDRERERGLDYSEDLFNPLALRFRLQPGRPAVVIASTEPHQAGQAEVLLEAEAARRASLSSASAPGGPLVHALAAAADQFVVQRGKGTTIIAGYPWFGDWGRDTLISLPGLALATGRFPIAREILATYAERVDQGMLPNQAGEDGGMPEYNTVDAPLWFFEAVRSYLAYTGDYEFIRKHVYEKLREIINWYMGGTRYGIRVDSDGLVACGEEGVQLTWMDAKVEDHVVTPRHGKPVEIQALWHNALLVMRELCERFGIEKSAVFLERFACLVRDWFLRRFWNEKAACLYDVVDGETGDASIRPNQIFAVSLHYPLLEGERARQVVDLVERELLTPMGLRTLSRSDARYWGRYQGGVAERDSAYHQGTVWPWLMGPFLTAYVRSHGESAVARAQAAEWLIPFERHLREAGLGQISEIADGEDPHPPRGAIAQAWSVAELLRAATESVYAPLRGARPDTAKRELETEPASN